MGNGFHCSNPFCTVILQPDEHSTVIYCPECTTWHVKVSGEWSAYAKETTSIEEADYLRAEREGIQQDHSALIDESRNTNRMTRNPRNQSIHHK